MATPSSPPSDPHPGSGSSRGLGLNLLLSVAVLALLVALLEGAGRLMEEEHPSRPLADYLWNWDTRWGGDFYTVGTDSTGWPPGQEFNADGLRDRFRPHEKPERTWRIACLGDSVTLGAGIETNEAYPQVLDRRLWLSGRRIEVFNVALWGWSTRQERFAYERIVRGYDPDQVILGVCLNDIAEIQNNLTQPPRWLAWLHERSAFVRLVVGARRREIANVEDLFAAPDSARNREAIERFLGEIRLLADTVRKDGVALHVVVFPFRFQVLPGAPPPSVQERILRFCRAEGIPALDLLPALSGLGEDAFVDYDHLSPQGALAVARVIEESAWMPSGFADGPALEAFLGRPIASAGPTVEELRRALAARDPEVRQAACGILMWSDGLSVDTLLLGDLARLVSSDPSSGVRAAAAAALGAWGGPLPRARGQLAAALRDPSESVRAEAARALATLGPPARGDVPDLMDLLTHADPYVASFAAWRLGALRRDAAEAVPALTQALERDDRVRVAAARALAQLGAVAGREAVPALLATLESDDPKERLNAVRALGRIGPSASEAVEPLTARLADVNAPVRAEAARALGRIGLAARVSAPELVECLRTDESPQVRAMAARALGWVAGGREVQEALVAASGDSHRKVAREARKALDRLGSR